MAFLVLSPCFWKEPDDTFYIGDLAPILCLVRAVLRLLLCVFIYSTSIYCERLMLGPTDRHGWCSSWQEFTFSVHRGGGEGKEGTESRVANKSIRDSPIMIGVVRKESKRHKAKGWDSMTIGGELLEVGGQGRPLWGHDEKKELGFRRKRKGFLGE